MIGMLTWSEFAERDPEMAAAGRSLFYQFGGVGLAFLGTVRPDGGPRMHPMCPVLVGDGLYAFLIPSPKRTDLRRDPRYAMHCFPADDNEDAFSIRGQARPVTDGSVRDAAAELYLAERSWSTSPPGFDDQELFEFLVERALLTRTTGHGDPNPRHQVWNQK
jgi:Pyridoxamine 5'-phosphate oxidase